MSVNNNHQSGSSLLEIIVAAFLLSTVIVSLVSITTLAVARNRSAKERVAATRLAQEVAEWLRFERDRQGFSAFYNHATTTTNPLCVTSVPEPSEEDDVGGALLIPEKVYESASCTLIDNKYDRKVLIEGNSPANTSVAYTVTVTWQRTATATDNVTVKGVLEKWSD